MNAYVSTSPALRRGLVARPRAHALFLSPTAQQVERCSLIGEVARAAVAVAAASAWCAVVVLLAG